MVIIFLSLGHENGQIFIPYLQSTVLCLLSQVFLANQQFISFSMHIDDFHVWIFFEVFPQFT